MTTESFLYWCRRYYSNTITDMEKQHAINLFLGNFVPNPQKPPLWDFESDHYLHGGQTNSSTALASVGSSANLSQVVASRSCNSSFSVQGSEDFDEETLEQKLPEARTSTVPSRQLFSFGLAN